MTNELEQVSISIPKERVAELLALSEKLGESLNKFIIAAIDEKVQHTAPPVVFDDGARKIWKTPKPFLDTTGYVWNREELYER